MYRYVLRVRVEVILKCIGTTQVVDEKIKSCRTHKIDEMYNLTRSLNLRVGVGNLNRTYTVRKNTINSVIACKSNQRLNLLWHKRHCSTISADAKNCGAPWKIV